jgi:NAD(P)-dependent dehydrogenase (short-subunit alcohol dehydrogenase family)
MTDMTGKVVVITGGTSGLGKESAKEIAKMGATVAITGRSLEKLDMAAREIKNLVPAAKIDTFLCDQSLMSEVRRLAKELLDKYPKINVLMNNAGITTQRAKLTSEGIEQVFATNHLAPFLLTNLLLERLVQSNARVVNVSSAMHKHVKINFDNLQSIKGFNWDSSYSRSKLMNLLFTYELARRMEGKTITVNAIHPGLVKTRIGHKDTALLSFGKAIADLFALTVEQGAKTQIYVATSPEVEGITGKYFAKCKVEESSTDSLKHDDWASLWEMSLTLIG